MKLLSILNRVFDKLGGVFNQKNLNSGMKAFDKGMAQFSKGLNDFGKSMDSVTSELSNDVKGSNDFAVERERINKKNLEKIYGNSNHTKIWSDKKSNESLF